MNLSITKISSVSAAGKNWYRVTGTRKSPILEKIAVWVVADYSQNDLNTGENLGHGGQLIMGLPARDLKVLGFDAAEQFSDVAGYVELSSKQLKLAQKHPKKLPHENLDWEIDAH